ncbi:putative ABC transport system permease protein [Flavobacterium arsenatis]|uniref:ABC transport system permease protein n=1 Tax=Flavobacterium arsenatis TaxID=1484332 RepID=A0ABU1TPH3_9FLAO|nr:ABC transporter permease [Flavobacterium arsenatis]MDR6967873.1 putative ABC transport system permease protein [Flavobacterium arsenatis]
MITKLAWKNIWYKPLNTLLSVILLTASVAIISLLILLQEQFEKQFSSNIDGVDLVIGAKGSPLQLILSSVYQVDAPTGNISYEEAKIWMKHPFVKTAIPLAFGDNYKGFKIVGTTPDYLEKYSAKVETGKIFSKNFEVVIGSEIAKKLNIKVGDKFFGSHGDAEEGEVHEEFAYVVSGIASPTRKVIDNLILSNIQSVWAMHDSHDHEAHSENPAHGEEGHVHEEGEEHHHDHKEAHSENPAHGEEGHVHEEGEEHHHDNKEAHSENPAHGEEGHVHEEGEEHDHDEISEEGKEITAVLIKFKNKMGFVLWPRLIAQNTDMQAASPAVEINRLFSLFGIGLQALQYLAYGIMLISGISIFIALYNTLKERKYEFALMRVSGASRLQLLGLVLFESLLLCTTGFFLGTIVGRVGLWLISTTTEQEYKMAFDPFAFALEKEGVLFLVTIFVGIIAALIPAIKAYRLNISKTLANA